MGRSFIGIFIRNISGFFFRNEGPKREMYQWEIDELLEEKKSKAEEININYIIKNKKKSS